MAKVFRSIGARADGAGYCGDATGYRCAACQDTSLTTVQETTMKTKSTTAAAQLAELHALCRFADVDPEDLAAGGAAAARAHSRIRAAAVISRLGLPERDIAPLIRLCERARVDPHALGSPLGAVRQLAIRNLTMYAEREEAGAPHWLPERDATSYGADGLPDTWGLNKLRAQRTAAQREARGSTADIPRGSTADIPTGDDVAEPPDSYGMVELARKRGSR